MYNGIAFFDMDGVLADCTHRLKYAENKDYDKFYSPVLIAKDMPIKAGIEMLRMMIVAGKKIVIVTSRREVSRDSTRQWLLDNGIEIPTEDIYCRYPGDTRKSWDVKLDLTERAIRKNMDAYLSGQSYFVDDYANNCLKIEKRYKSMQTIVFGCGRLDDLEGGEL